MKLSDNKILQLEEKESLSFDSSYAETYLKDKMDRDSGVFGRGQQDTIVVHYTGGTTAKSAINALFNSKREVSAHFVIDVDGKVYQLMPLDKVAWHAGRSSMGNRKGLNKYSIGIEIVNPGFLKQSSSGSFYTYYNQEVKADKAIEAKHKNESDSRFWHVFEPVQIEAAADLCIELSELLNIKYIVGHDEISPGRKQDPGPLFPLEKLREDVLNSRKYEDEPETIDLPKFGHVTTPRLNIREHGDSSSQKIALPLSKGQKVEVLDNKEGWLKVKTDLVGWVSSKYID